MEFETGLFQAWKSFEMSQVLENIHHVYYAWLGQQTDPKNDPRNMQTDPNGPERTQKILARALSVRARSCPQPPCCRGPPARLSDQVLNLSTCRYRISILSTINNTKVLPIN